MIIAHNVLQLLASNFICKPSMYAVLMSIVSINILPIGRSVMIPGEDNRLHFTNIAPVLMAHGYSIIVDLNER